MLQGWIQDPVSVTVGGAGRVPAGLQHRYLLVPEQVKLLALCRLLRQDILECAPALSLTSVPLIPLLSRFPMLIVLLSSISQIQGNRLCPPP